MGRFGDKMSAPQMLHTIHFWVDPQQTDEAIGFRNDGAILIDGKVICCKPQIYQAMCRYVAQTGVQMPELADGAYETK